MKDQFDVVVIGAGAPGLCAAASAALGGARVGLIGVAAADACAEIMTATIPGFVWRRLGLDRFDIETEPASARITLLGKDKVVSSVKSVRESAEQIGEADSDVGVLWRELFTAARERGAGFDAAPGVFSPARAYDEIDRMLVACRETVEDYFGDEPVAAHILAHAMTPSGLSGWEAGTSGQLSGLAAPDAWPERVSRGDLIAALKSVCAEAGVEMFSGDAAIEPCDKARWRQLRIGDAAIRTRRIFFSSPGAAAVFGAEACDPAASAALGGASVCVRLRLRDEIAPPAGDRAAVFQIIDNADELVAARDAARSGALASRLPVSFRFDASGDLIASSAYCPRSFVDEDGDERGWSGQDRQAAMMRIVDKLKEHMPTLSKNIRKVETHLSGDRSALPERDCSGVYILSDYFDSIGAAVRLMDNALGAHV